MAASPASTKALCDASVSAEDALVVSQTVVEAAHFEYEAALVAESAAASAHDVCTSTLSTLGGDDDRQGQGGGRRVEEHVDARLGRLDGRRHRHLDDGLGGQVRRVRAVAYRRPDVGVGRREDGGEGQDDRVRGAANGEGDGDEHDVGQVGGRQRQDGAPHLRRGHRQGRVRQDEGADHLR
eukprot:7250489-Prymnesium_polylepis.1